MNREISLRQISFMYLFISVSSVLRQVPQNLAADADRSGYLSPLWSVPVLAALTGIIIILIKKYPGLNLYEIMVHLLGKLIANLLIFLYLLWLLLSIAAKVTAYNLTLQLTLMPRTRAEYFMIVLAVMVFYALLRGIKTIFRFSELSLSSVLILFAIMFVCAIGSIRTDYLLPVSITHFNETIYAAKHVITIGGNIIITLFFADKLGVAVTKAQYRKLWIATLTFAVFTFIIVLFTFGISGTGLTANTPFPFYITVKSISFFNVFERFEVLVTLICLLSDFASICIMVLLIMRCLCWLFNLDDCFYVCIPLAMVIFYLTYYVSSTQFEFNYLYKNIIEKLNLIFQYGVPVLLVFAFVIRGKKLRQPY